MAMGLRLEVGQKEMEMLRDEGGDGRFEENRDLGMWVEAENEVEKAKGAERY